VAWIGTSCTGIGLWALPLQAQGGVVEMVGLVLALAWHQ